MTKLADTPVLVGRTDACTILGVSDTTFARLCREGRFENMCCGGGDPLYRSAELRAYRAKSRCRGASSKGVTNDFSSPRKTAPLRVTSKTEIAGCTGEPSEPGNHTWPRCEGCQKPFRPHRAGQRACSPRCRKRVSRRVGRAA
jgi:hypothetical protein